MEMVGAGGTASGTVVEHRDVGVGVKRAVDVGVDVSDALRLMG